MAASKAKPKRTSSKTAKGKTKASSVKDGSVPIDKGGEPQVTRRPRKPAPKGKDGKFVRSAASIRREQSGVIHNQKSVNHVAGAFKRIHGGELAKADAETVDKLASHVAKNPEARKAAVSIISKINYGLAKKEAINHLIESSPIAARYLVCLVKGKYDDGTPITDAPHAVRLQAARSILEYSGIHQLDQKDMRELSEMTHDQLLLEHRALEQELAGREATDAEVIPADAPEAPQQTAETTA